MRLIEDSNVLLRAVLDDDQVQGRASRPALSSADRVVIGRQVFCEMFRLFRQRYNWLMPVAATIVRVDRRVAAGG